MDETHQPRRILVTGGAGFVGGNFLRHFLASEPGCEAVNLDSLAHPGCEAAVAEIGAAFPGRHRFVRADIRDAAAVAAVFAREEPDTVVNFAAESHVDHSIARPLDFVSANVMGTAVLLDAARTAWAGRKDVRFHQVSTDEVFGSLGGGGRFVEESPYHPSSPYSAAKAGADHLARAWSRTYGLPVTLSHSSNNYGPWQFPEKLLPLTILNALEERPLPIYGDGGNVRDWLHVDDHARAILSILRRGRVGESYNVGGGEEWANVDLVRLVCRILDRLRPRRAGPYEELMTFVADRPGHDFRYALDCRKLAGETGWRPLVAFGEGLEQTVQWYVDNMEWVGKAGLSRTP